MRDGDGHGRRSPLRPLLHLTSRCASDNDCTVSTPASDYLGLNTLSCSLCGLLLRPSHNYHHAWSSVYVPPPAQRRIPFMLTLHSYRRPRRVHIATVEERAAGRVGHRGNMRQNEGAPHEGKQCGAHQSTGHCRWRHPRPVLRHDGNLQDWWTMSGHELPVSR